MATVAAAASTHAALFLNSSSPSGTTISGRGVVSAKAAAAAASPLRSLSNSSTGCIPSVPASSFTVGGQFSSRPSLFRSWAPARAVPSSGFYVKAGASSEKKKVLVVNTNSGGHAIIGFYFAQQLLSSGHEVTVLTVGDESSDKMKKPPFNRFSELVAAGGKTVWGDPSEVGKIIGDEVFDVVLENNGKDLETVKPVVDWAKSSGVKQFLYISSAGIYKPEDEIPHVEGDLVKGDASHVSVEKYLSETFTRWSIFRPQYMIGSGNNKDCEEWFFDRIVRGRPVPIPGSGMQLTNIAHTRDLASMLCLAVDKPVESCCKIFNCVTDRAITFNGLAKLCSLAAGCELKIVHFDPKAVGVDPRKAFPFRNMHFYAEPRAAKEVLGWTATTDLAEDLKERFDEYVKVGRDKKQIEFEVDDKILKFVGAA